MPGNVDSLISQLGHPQLNDSADGDKASIAKLFERGDSFDGLRAFFFDFAPHFLYEIRLTLAFIIVRLWPLQVGESQRFT